MSARSAPFSRSSAKERLSPSTPEKLNAIQRSPGAWVRIYASREHVFAVIAGLRWDTSSDEGDGQGPGWSEEMRSTRGFRARHPLGLLSAEPLGR